MKDKHLIEKLFKEEDKHLILLKLKLHDELKFKVSNSNLEKVIELSKKLHNVINDNNNSNNINNLSYNNNSTKKNLNQSLISTFAVSNSSTLTNSSLLKSSNPKSKNSNKNEKLMTVTKNKKSVF